MIETLSRRALNRATLARQLLLERASLPVVEATRRLVGLQAQTPHTWYVGLWSRLAGFEPAEVGRLLVERQLVRVVVMRGTIHLVTAQDCLPLRSLVQPVLDRGLAGNYGKALPGVDRAQLAAATARALADGPLTFSVLGRELARQWPDRDPAALAQAARAWVPLVQVPPRGVWGRSGPVAHLPAVAWLSDGQAEPGDDWAGSGDDWAASGPQWPVAELVRRYLAAFGPATVADVQVWSGLTRLREVVAELRPSLRSFRDEHGRELFDLPEAPRPDPDQPAPARFLYDFDNLLLSHDDRIRVVTGDIRRMAYPPYGPIPQFLLVDGFTAGDWRLQRERGAVRLVIRPFRPLTGAERAEVDAEAAALLRLLAASAESAEVEVTAPV